MQGLIVRKLRVMSGETRVTRLSVANNERVGIGDPAINRSWRWRNGDGVMRRCNRGCLGEGQIAAGSQHARCRYEGAQ